MRFFTAATIVGFSSLASAQFTNPPPENAPADPSTNNECTYWRVIQTGDTCATVAAENLISVENLRAWVSLVFTAP
jgi:hypothetical protein